jgi:sialic acid synthase SpsE
VNQPNREFQIDDKWIGFDHKTYFIADIAANHDGNIERAKELIYLAAESGADAAKFQHFKANTIVSDRGFKSLTGGESHQSSWKKSVFEVYEDAAVSLNWTSELKETCEDASITFLTSPYSFDLADEVFNYVSAYKIGSGDITWIDIIKYIANKQKPYILAAGASNMNDVTRAVSEGLLINQDLCLMQCNTNYTASLENFKYIKLNVLKTFRNMYPNLILGLSDHTPGHSTVLGAVALGAKMIEKHFTDDNNRKGPDHEFAMDPRSWKEMVDRSRELENSLGDGIKQVEKNEIETVVLQRRSIRLTGDIKKNHVLSDTDFVVLRPCPPDAIPPYRLGDLVGRTVSKNICKGECIKWTDLK